MTTIVEPKIGFRSLVYVYPKPLSYGFTDKEAVYEELIARLNIVCGVKNVNVRNVSRPLYPMQLAGFVADSICQMVTGPATAVYKSYKAVDFPNGAILYIEEVGERWFLFVLSPGDSLGFSQLRRLI